MANEEMGDLLNQIGQEVANILGKSPEDAFVFIEAADQMSGGAIFENRPDNVVYHDFGHEIHEAILRLWEAAEPDRKWSMLLYDIRGGGFDVEFLYADALPDEWYSLDYEQDALKARYGNKPIIYPPMDNDDWHELSEDDLPDEEADPA